MYQFINICIGSHWKDTIENIECGWAWQCTPVILATLMAEAEGLRITAWATARPCLEK